MAFTDSEKKQVDWILQKFWHVNDIYRLVKKRHGRARILSNALVTLKGG